MRITVKKANTGKTSLANMVHTILSLTNCGDCVTCNSVEQYLTHEAHYSTYTAEVSTILKLLCEMGYFTIEHGKVENSCNRSVIKIYTRTNKVNVTF